MTRQALILTPEPPYPLRSGGAYRTASLLHYFAERAAVDLLLFSEGGAPALLPEGLVRQQRTIALPRHARGKAARYARNARRALVGRPPLVDRLRGFHLNAPSEGPYDVGLVEHFWCAPYVDRMKALCRYVILDLHNVESALHERYGETDRGLAGMGQRRFARAYRKLEQRLLPKFDLVLAPSEDDAALVLRRAPDTHAAVFPNALPNSERPNLKENETLVVFPGNFEYHPNLDAVRFLAKEIWPKVVQLNSSARVRLVGRGDGFVRSEIDAEFTGPVEDALSEIAQAAVVIAPLRAGSGTRIKILEAWKAARAVVATPLAAEGLDARHGENIVLAESPGDFAAAVVRLLKDPRERRGLGESGRRTLEERYTWDVVWRTLDGHLKAGPLSVGGYTE